MSGTCLTAFPFRLPSPFLSRAATRLTPRAMHGLALCDPLRRVLVWFDVDMLWYWKIYIIASLNCQLNPVYHLNAVPPVVQSL